MRVAALQTLGFRNLAPGRLDLGEGITLLWGPNGAGKTNAARGHLPGAQRTLQPDPKRAGSDRLRPAAGPDRGRGGRTAARHTSSCGRWIGPAIAATSSTTAPRRRSTRSFAPRWRSSCPTAWRWSRARRPCGGRTWIASCAALWPARAEARRRYGRALAQRNALLGRVRSGAAPVDSLVAWERELAALGVELIRSRREAVGLLASEFAEAAAELCLARRRRAPLPAAQLPPPTPGQLAAELQRAPRGRSGARLHGPRTAPG